MDFTKSDLRISTMTVTANWGMPVNLDLLFEQLKAHFIPIGYPAEGIIKFEHKSKVLGACHKDLFTNRKTTKKSFFNQSTIILRRVFGSGWKEVNMKLFDNGGIQMTGVTSKDFATDSVAWLLKLILTLPISPFIVVLASDPTKVGGSVPTVATVVAPPDATTIAAAATVKSGRKPAKPKPVKIIQASSLTPSITKVNVSLINTDYSLNRDIQQDTLHRLFIERYNLFSMLEKTIYQGVNAKYFYNTNNKGTGVCACGADSFCKGQGTGDGKGECKRITMSIFRTGKIIITGARTMEQIQEAYDFLNSVFERHANDVLIKRV
jgi:hypothetical protein